MGKRSRWSNKPFLFLIILLCICYLYFVIYPFLDAYIMKRVSFERQIDPTFLNGLLTASSILFGFSSLLVIAEKPIGKTLWLILIIPVVLITLAGSWISDVALGKRKTVEALLALTASFNANIATTMFLVGYRVATWFGKKEN